MNAQHFYLNSDPHGINPTAAAVIVNTIQANVIIDTRSGIQLGAIQGVQVNTVSSLGDFLGVIEMKRSQRCTKPLESYVAHFDRHGSACSVGSIYDGQMPEKIYQKGGIVSAIRAFYKDRIRSERKMAFTTLYNIPNWNNDTCRCSNEAVKYLNGIVIPGYWLGVECNEKTIKLLGSIGGQDLAIGLVDIVNE